MKALYDWVNDEVFLWVRRIDLAIAATGISIVGYYWYYYGWRSAILASLMYAMSVMIGLWFL